MDAEEQITGLEEGFWRASFAGDGDYYAEHLAEDALLVFAEPTGVLEKAACVEIIAGSPASQVSWEISERRFVRLADEVVALTYKGRATPEGGASERDRRTSVYRREGGRWRMVLHHVTREADPTG